MKKTNTAGMRQQFKRNTSKMSLSSRLSDLISFTAVCVCMNEYFSSQHEIACSWCEEDETCIRCVAMRAFFLLLLLFSVFLTASFVQQSEQRELFSNKFIYVFAIHSFTHLNQLVSLYFEYLSTLQQKKNEKFDMIIIRIKQK